MRYSRDHKAETHAKIVRSASVQLREKGTRGVGVVDLMREAGLTHGGFYAHFGSREDLVVEAIAYAMDRSTYRWGRLVEDKPADERLAMLIDSYLTAQHRDGAGRGCAIASLAVDVTREGQKTRRVFLSKLEAMIALFAEQVPGETGETARRKAVATIATLVGTMVLARAAGNTAFSEEILDAGRAAALGAACKIDASAAKPSRQPPPRRRSAPRNVRKVAES